MLKKAKELFFKFRTRHFKFIEFRKSLRFDTSAYYPYQIMDIGESFLIDNANLETIQKKHKTINKELSKTFLAKIEADAVRITRIK
ncbi:hypothetical protein [Candidatus Methylopumilus universalis]|uniref:hypothetical protein n=1 Tax=Candidatus Methylopumilus universalis TaxID=2588536 RepID=UPI003BEF2982